MRRQRRSNGSFFFAFDFACFNIPPTENHLIQVDGTLGTCSTAAACYVYDAEGKRVQKVIGASQTSYLYDLSGKVVAEDYGAAWAVGYVYAGGQLIAQYKNDTTFFVHPDHLGSTRLMTSMNQSIYDSMDYLPFGEQIAGDTGATHKFTGKERDAESNLDNFGARYDSSSLGRFMSPDPLNATPLHIINPQRWNMYAYVINNPLTYIDPDGKDAIAVNLVGMVPLGGHAGIIVVHSDGSATYARFGPAHEASPADKGNVRVESLRPVEFGPQGLPTDASYKELAEEVGKLEGQPPSTVGFNYFKTPEADSILLDSWMQYWKTAQAPDYSVTFQNCAAFCIAGLVVGHAIENRNISLVPNRLFMLLSRLASENWTWEGRSPRRLVTSQICTTDEQGKKHCQSTE